jgi:membrane protein YqaA with SNARE-associated domain
MIYVIVALCAMLCGALVSYLLIRPYLRVVHHENLEAKEKNEQLDARKHELEYECSVLMEKKEYVETDL